MSITITTLNWAPPPARGLVRDLRVRWALEEAGLSYEEKLVDFASLKSEEFRQFQPFRQVPVYQEDNLTLFETGSILIHLGEKSEALLPREASRKARAISWMLSALNSVEPPLQHLTTLDLFHREESWAQQARPQALKNARRKLKALEKHLQDREYLEERFTIADLMMTTVLRIPRHCELLKEFPKVDAFRQRQEQRPSFCKALEAQMAQFVGEAPF